MPEYVTSSMKAATLDPEVVSGVLTKKDILSRLAEHDMMDEMIVANKYLDYAVALDKPDEHALSKAFCDMAHEEFSHARAQRQMLTEAGYRMTDEGTTAYEELKERFKHIFRD